MPVQPSSRTSPAFAPRLHAVDALRALAMLLGLVLHASLAFLTVNHIATPLVDRSRFVGFDVAVLAIHAFRMQLFFVVAGFFTALLLARRTPADFLRARLLRLGLPLLVGVFTIIPLTRWAKAMAHGGSPHFWNLTDQPGHLWFLVYLLEFSAIALLLVLAVRRWPEWRVGGLGGIFNFSARFIQPPLGLPLLVLLTIPLTLAPSDWRIKTPTSWLPEPGPFAYYGLCFFVGCAFWRSGNLSRIGRSWWWLLPVALLIVLPLSALVDLVWMPHWLAHAGTGWLGIRAAHIPAVVLQSILTWTMIFGLFGLAQRVCRVEHPWLRHLADSSYWVYLIHLPVIYWAELSIRHMSLLGMSPGPAEAVAKFLVLVAFTAALCFGTYFLLIKPTPLNRVIGGRTLAPRVPVVQPPTRDLGRRFPGPTPRPSLAHAPRSPRESPLRSPHDANR